jgi:CheY-like chemotaxis protein
MAAGLAGGVMAMQRMHIVQVEDNAVDVEAVQRALGQHGFTGEIHVARDGAEALALLRSGTVPRPHVILVDLNLPRMSGIELLHALRHDAALRDSVVFVLTTSTREEDKRACYEHQVAGYIVKGNVGSNFSSFAAMMEAYARVVDLPPAGGR